MKLLTEYQGIKRSASVFQREDDYLAIGYSNNQQDAQHKFEMEHQAERWAENWVISEKWVNEIC